jgi:hypothetical protein
VKRKRERDAETKKKEKKKAAAKKGKKTAKKKKNVTKAAAPRTPKPPKPAKTAARKSRSPKAGILKSPRHKANTLAQHLAENPGGEYNSTCVGSKLADLPNSTYL